MCRVFNDSDNALKPNSIIKTLGTIQSVLEKDREIYNTLINYSLQWLGTNTQNLEIDSSPFKNPFFYTILEILYLLIRTNVFEHLTQESSYSKLVHCLINIINHENKPKSKKLLI